MHMLMVLRRGALTLAASAAVAVAAAPAAQAAPRAVCNQASPHWLGGGLVALDPPVESPAARYTTDLGPLPGKGVGLPGAAAHSPALTLCGGAVVPSDPSDPIGGDTGGDGGSAS
jgi:hypothetical protein